MSLDFIRPWHILAASLPFGLINWTNKYIKFGFEGSADALIALLITAALIDAWRKLDRIRKETGNE